MKILVGGLLLLQSMTFTHTGHTGIILMTYGIIIIYDSKENIDMPVIAVYPCA